MGAHSAPEPTPRQTTAGTHRESVWVVCLWLLWALLPLPLVWISFYSLHSFWIAILAYGGLVCVFPSLMSHLFKLLFWQDALRGMMYPRFRLAYSHRLALTVLILIGLTWLVVAGGWLWFKASLLKWRTFPDELAGIGLSKGLPFYALLAYFVVLNPVVEEFFWRGILYERLKGTMSQWNALLISSLLFGAWHWVIIQYFFAPEWQLPLTLLLCLGGMVFGLLYEKAGSLLPAILVHGLGADLVIMAILWDALNGAP